MLYEIITLEQAFPGRIDSGVLNRILNEGPTPIEDRVPGIDPDLASIVRRAMQRDPEERYRHAFEMGRDVARVRRRLADAPAVPAQLVESTARKAPALSEEQETMLRAVASSKDRVVCVVGLAGSGKTTATRAVADAFRAAGVPVLGAAPSGIAWGASAETSE